MSLGATPAQIGILAAVVRGPGILVGLTAGGLVDRRRRRPLLVGCDVGRAVVLASMPLAAWMHVLTMTQVYVVAALVAALSVLFDIADHAYLPSLIAKDQLVEGNSKLATTDAAPPMIGGRPCGVLVQFTAHRHRGQCSDLCGPASPLAPSDRRSRCRRQTGARVDLAGDIRIGLAAVHGRPCKTAAADHHRQRPVRLVLFRPLHHLRAQAASPQRDHAGRHRRRGRGRGHVRGRPRRALGPSVQHRPGVRHPPRRDCGGSICSFLAAGRRRAWSC